MRSTASSSAADDCVEADFDSLEQAADWYAVLYAEGDNDERREAWAAWLEARPEHRRAWAHIESVSRRFAPLRVQAPGEREAAVTALRVSARHAAKPSSGRRRTLASLAALGATGAAAWLGWRCSPLPGLVVAWRSDYRTGTGERRDVVLADGTRVWLNTDSALDVDYNGERRLLTLNAGEILVDTAKDARGRPFYVESRDGTMQALGTRFTVRETAAFTRLSVFDGLVEIRTRSGITARVPAGQQRQFTPDAISDAVAADRAREAWSRGIILAEDIPLSDLIAELARYRRGHIGVDPRVAGIRVVGRYPAGNPDQVLAMLARDLPVAVRRTLPWWTTIEPR